MYDRAVHWNVNTSARNGKGVKEEMMEHVESDDNRDEGRCGYECMW